MEEDIISLREEFEFEYEKLEIESSKSLFDKYRNKIPVLMVNDIIFAKYKVDKEKLKKRIRS